MHVFDIMKTLLLSLHPVENMSSFFECFKVKVCHRLKIVPLKLSVKRVKPIKQMLLVLKTLTT